MRSLSSMFRPGQAMLSLNERLDILNTVVPSASDSSESAGEIRNWVLEMVALSVEDCSTSRKAGPDGKVLVNLIVAYHGFDNLTTK